MTNIRGGFKIFNKGGWYIVMEDSLVGQYCVGVGGKRGGGGGMKKEGNTIFELGPFSKWHFIHKSSKHA